MGGLEPLSRRLIIISTRREDGAAVLSLTDRGGGIEADRAVQTVGCTPATITALARRGLIAIERETVARAQWSRFGEGTPRGPVTGRWT